MRRIIRNIFNILRILGATVLGTTIVLAIAGGLSDDLVFWILGSLITTAVSWMIADALREEVYYV